MTVLWINLAIVFILSFFARYFAIPIRNRIHSLPIKPNKLLVFGAMIYH